ncbi:MAG: glycosyltransferase family 4 protein [Bacteroidetes bacterium]|nr:glycosyltransferase family 4 protein [Bacteroidota bacterium]
MAGQIQTRLKPDTEIIFSPGSIPVSLLETQIPKVFYTGACFGGMVGFYEGFSRLSAETIRYGHFLEQAALSSSKLVLYASDWGKQTAIENYNVDPEKIKVIPYGANLESSFTLNEIKTQISNRSDSVCKLLFIGVEWKRKGGDIALEVATEMNRRGIKTELHVVGLKDIPLKKIPFFLIDHGFLNKAIPAQKVKLERLLASSHFLIVPSKAEAFGVVFAEASAWAIPSVSFHVGGIPTAVKNGQNGHLFAPEAGVTEFSDYLSDLFTDKTRYNDLALSSFNEFQTRLNWDVAGKTIMKHLKDL